jgi:hypothetical protein
MVLLQNIRSKFYVTRVLFSFSFSWIQAQETTEKGSSKFSDHVSFGEGIGLGVGSNYFSAYVAPSAVYNFNKYLSAGPGLQYSYQSGQNVNANIYGGSFIILANSLDAVQLSTEIEQVYVQQNQEFNFRNFTAIFWETALFIRAGYKAWPVTIGLLYNALFQEEDGIYATAWIPFMCVLF